MVLVSLLVNVTLLQLRDEPLTDRADRATALLTEAARGGADIAVLPAGFGADGPDQQTLGRYSALAEKLGIAICSTYETAEASSLTLFAYNGTKVLEYTAPRSSADAPRAGRHPKSVELELKRACATPACPPRMVKLGAMLGTDYLFFQPARVLMVQGAEIVLNPVAVKGLHTASASSEEANHTTDGRAMSTLAQDNFVHYATANYATINGSDAGGSGGGRGGMSFAAPQESVIVQIVNVSQIRAERLTAGVWSGGTDFLSRKPFQYQPLCYEEARADHVAANVQPSERQEIEGPKLKVAMLQMNAVGVGEGVDPVPAHMERATMFTREAVKRGADIVLFPEQWSVGFSRNFRKHDYLNADSFDTIYGSYVKWAQRIDGAFMTHFRGLAKELGVAIAAAYTENIDGVTGPGDKLPPRNSVALIDRTGAVLHDFKKVHIAWSGTPSDTDCEGITGAGRAFYTSLLDLGDARGNVSVCSLICFDREHPESAALCAAGGAELVMHPTACGMDMDRIDKLASRAMQGVMAIAMANFGNSTDTVDRHGRPCVGTNDCSSQQSWGRSAAVNASGDIVALAPDVPVPTVEERDMGWQVGEAIVMAEFDIGAQRKLRKTSRGVGMREGSAQLEPELCRVPLAAEYRQGNLDEARMWL
jgi:predicted amidohydrolase